MSRIRCMRFSGRINSPLNSGLKHYSDPTECDPNYCNATNEHLYERLTTFCTIFKGPNMNHSWLRVCFATLRLLLKVSHVILKRFTIIAPLVSFNLPWFVTSIYTLYKYLCVRPQLTMDTAHLLLHAFNYDYWRALGTGGIHTSTPFDSPDRSYHGTHDRTSAPRPIALTPVQSSDHLITRDILSHYLTALAFTVQQSHIDTRYIARFNAFASHNVSFGACVFRRNTFSPAIIWASVYDLNLHFVGGANILSLLLVHQ